MRNATKRKLLQHINKRRNQNISISASSKRGINAFIRKASGLSGIKGTFDIYCGRNFEKSLPEEEFVLVLIYRRHIVASIAFSGKLMIVKVGGCNVAVYSVSNVNINEACKALKVERRANERVND